MSCRGENGTHMKGTLKNRHKTHETKKDEGAAEEKIEHILKRAMKKNR